MPRAVADAFNRIAENGGGANGCFIGRDASADSRAMFGAPGKQASSLSPPEFLARTSKEGQGWLSGHEEKDSDLQLERVWAIEGG